MHPTDEMFLHQSVTPFGKTNYVKPPPHNKNKKHFNVCILGQEGKISVSGFPTEPKICIDKKKVAIRSWFVLCQCIWWLSTFWNVFVV
jgi:hypothetical protein